MPTLASVCHILPHLLGTQTHVLSDNLKSIMFSLDLLTAAVYAVCPEVWLTNVIEENWVLLHQQQSNSHSYLTGSLILHLSPLFCAGNFVNLKHEHIYAVQSLYAVCVSSFCVWKTLFLQSFPSSVVFAIFLPHIHTDSWALAGWVIIWTSPFEAEHSEACYSLHID